MGVGSLKCGDWIAVYRDLSAYNHESFVIRRYDQNGERVWTRTIGRGLAPDGVQLVVEEEAAYLFYREYAEGKEPGFKIFRIGVDDHDLAAVFRKTPAKVMPERAHSDKQK